MKRCTIFVALAVFLSASTLAESVVTEFYPGKDTFLDSASHSNTFAVVFEDDGDTGYFYALDTSNEDQPILDAVHIYNVKDVVDSHKVSEAKVIWSETGEQAALLINGYPHAVFDFAAKRGYCRTGFPPPAEGWSSDGHAWDDAAMKFFE